jgi:hypothetical protein
MLRTSSAGLNVLTNGSAAAVSLGINDSNTGLFRPGTDELAIAAGGVTSSVFDSSGIKLPDGSAATPSISFISDNTMGLYRAGTNQMDFVVGGNVPLRLTNQAGQFRDGTYEFPTIGFLSDTNTGLFRPGTDQLGISTGGATSAVFNTSGLRLPQLSNTLISVDVNGQLIATQSTLLPALTYSPIKQNVDITHTGTTSNTIIATYSIPVHTFEPNDIFRFRILTSVTNNANVKTMRVYFNSTPDLSGVSLISTRTMTSSAGSSIARDIIFKNSLSSFDISSVNSSIGDDENNANVAITNITSVDFTTQQYMIVAIELASAADSVVIKGIRSQIFR